MMTRYRSNLEIFISPERSAKEKEMDQFEDKGPPDPPATRPAAVADPAGVVVTWSSPPYDGGRCVESYRVESRTESESDWRVVAERCHSLSVVVRDLAPGRRHLFRVRAENVHGLSDPSPQSQPFCTPALAESSEEPPPPPFSPRHVTVEPLEEFRARFEVLEELGKGRYGVVHRVTEAATGHTLAAKLIRTIKAKDRQQVHDEIDIMNILRHPKLLQLAAAFESPREVVMIMEYISGGELFERVVADDFTLTERDCVLFMRQICEGVDYMHQNQVVHLDLKPENIMCQTRTSHQIKLIDFGLAQKLKPDTPVRVLFGTPEFIPPEIINYEPIGTESDMWSVGVICYVLLSGLSPFMGDNDAETFANITRADFDFDDEAFDAISQDARDFIGALLVKRKEKRLTAKECLEHPWLAQQPANISCIALSTDKLKKFIIRRKWQKTGNAIRALGRMATLSAASRRNSSASSTAGTPRQSLSGFPTTPTTPCRAAALGKEDCGEEMLLEEAVTATLLPRGRFQSERSDSGISDCSSGSSKNQSALHPSVGQFSISEEVDEPGDSPSPVTPDVPDAFPSPHNETPPSPSPPPDSPTPDSPPSDTLPSDSPTSDSPTSDSPPSDSSPSDSLPPNSLPPDSPPPDSPPPDSPPPPLPAAPPPASPLLTRRAATPPQSPTPAIAVVPVPSSPTPTRAISYHGGLSSVSRRSAELLQKFESNASSCSPSPSPPAGAGVAASAVRKAGAGPGAGTPARPTAGLSAGARLNGIGAARPSSRTATGFVESKIKTLESRGSSKSIPVSISVVPPKEPRAPSGRVSLRDCQKASPQRLGPGALSPSRPPLSCGRTSVSPNRAALSSGRMSVSPSRTVTATARSPSRTEAITTRTASSPGRRGASPLRRVESPVRRLASPARSPAPAGTSPSRTLKVGSPFLDGSLRTSKEGVIHSSPPKSPTLRRMRIDGISANKLGTHSAGFQKTLEFWKR